MQEERWSSEGGDAVRREARRGGTMTRPRYGSESALLEPVEPSTRVNARRFAPYTGTETDRDALASMALAALQSVAQAPSVLDVDAASLRLRDADERPALESEPAWTPPVLLVTEEDSDDLDEELGDDELPGAPTSTRATATSSGRTWFAGVVAVVLVALLGGGLWTTMSEDEDTGVATADTRVSAASVADPALLPEAGLAETADDSAAPPIANVEGKLTLTDATLHDALAGDVAPAATSFPVGAQISMWLDLAYAGQGEADRLSVLWFRDGVEVGRDEQVLVDGPLQDRRPGPVLDTAGTHRADITLNDEVIASVEFEVTAP